MRETLGAQFVCLKSISEAASYMLTAETVAKTRPQAERCIVQAVDWLMCWWFYPRLP